MILGIWLFVSIVLLLFTFYYFYEFLRHKRQKHHLYWDITSFFLSLFLTIFGFYGYANMRNIDETKIPLGIILYFFSAIFVLFIVRRAYKLISDLKQNEEHFKDLALKFEYETKQKTIELEKKVTELENSRSAMINILEDISKQKEDIEESKKNLEIMNSKLEQSNKALLELEEKKNQFTSIAAHELKTPLASIHGFIQLLQKKEVMDDRSKLERYMKIVLADSDRLSKLITDILDISRMDLGTLVLDNQTISLKEVLSEIKDMMEPQMNEKRIKATYTILGGCPENILLDKTRLVEVLSNLISNAIHYTNEGGKIDVMVKQEGNNFIFSVIDTGMGIAKEEHEKIFERFYQVDNWLTRKIGGSGLGLAICKGIVTAFGGKIWVESELDKGASFFFTIPLIMHIPHK